MAPHASDASRSAKRSPWIVWLNLHVINSIAPDIKLKTILVGSMPYVGCMVVAILLLCVYPGIATWLPDAVMGPAR